MFKFFRSKKIKEQEVNPILPVSYKNKIQQYSYGVKVGERLRKYLFSNNLETLPIIISKRKETPFYLGFNHGLRNDTSSPNYKVEEVETTVNSPFTCSVTLKDFAKKESPSSEIYLRHS